METTSETSLEGWKHGRAVRHEPVHLASETSLEGWKLRSRALPWLRRTTSETSLEGWKHRRSAGRRRRCEAFRNFLRGMETNQLRLSV